MHPLRQLVLAILLSSPLLQAQESCFQVLKIELQNSGARDSLNIEERLAQTKNTFLKIGAGRNIRWMHLPPAKANLPTLLLLPGVNRGLVLQDEFVANIAVHGFGVASFDFSVQPLSIQTLSAGEKFLSSRELKNYGLNEMKAEVELVAKHLKDSGAQLVIPVSISYSGAVSSLLKEFPAFVDLVPMTNWGATNPAVYDVYRNLKLAETFNPFFGDAITRASMDATYRQKMKDQVETITQQFALDVDRKTDMLSGYMALSRAVESFQWDVGQTGQEPRVMVLAGNEAPSLAKSQIATFKQLRAEGRNIKLVIIEESGHIVTADKPQVLASVMLRVADIVNSETLQVLVITPSTGQSRTLTLDQLP